MDFLANYFGSLNPMSFLSALPGNIAQGIIWGLMGLGVFLTFKLLNFADLSVDGSFATGGAVTAVMLINGCPVWATIIVAILAGLAAGLVTGLLHTLLGIPDILAGILTQIALYSINLNIMGKSNLPISYRNYTLVVSASNINMAILVGLGICAVVIAAALGFIGFCVYNGLSNSSTDNKATTAETATSAEVTTQAPSTAMPTTVPATTEQVTTSSSYNNVVPVVGYGYSYGKKLLEQAGFTVEISDYEYSYDYPEGYIISQTPEGDTSASTGTVVKLVISSGQIQRETEAPATQAQQSSNSQNSSSGNSNSQSSSNTNTNNNGGFIFPNSDSSYLSNAQVSALSDDDLQLAINEIYARRGRIFKDASLNAYFNSQSWYEGKYTPEEFEKNVKFNTYEQKNLQLLINERRSRK